MPACGVTGRRTQYVCILIVDPRFLVFLTSLAQFSAKPVMVRYLRTITSVVVLCTRCLPTCPVPVSFACTRPGDVNLSRRAHPGCPFRLHVHLTNPRSHSRTA